MSPKPDSPSPLQSAPERSDPTPELLRSAPERSGAHQYCRSDAPNPTDTCGFSSMLCFPRYLLMIYLNTLPMCGKTQDGGKTHVSVGFGASER